MKRRVKLPRCSVLAPVVVDPSLEMPEAVGAPWFVRRLHSSDEGGRQPSMLQGRV